MAFAASGCLVTSTPQYDAPQQTPPVIVPGSEIPSLMSVIYVTAESAAHMPFSVDVMSEDAGSPVELSLLVDYGNFQQDTMQPYLNVANHTSIAAGTLADGPRPASLLLPTGLVSSPAGCHTLTLFAAHGLDELNGCPRCRTDSSMVTWMVFSCPSDMGSSCTDVSVDVNDCGLLTNTWTAGCPDEADDAGTCPTFGDAGAP